MVPDESTSVNRHSAGNTDATIVEELDGISNQTHPAMLKIPFSIDASCAHWNISFIAVFQG
jgi:hypothetical protein